MNNLLADFLLKQTGLQTMQDCTKSLDYGWAGGLFREINSFQVKLFSRLNFGLSFELWLELKIKYQRVLGKTYSGKSYLQQYNNTSFSFYAPEAHIM